MADGTKIAWCDATWNPIVGCSPAGVGCVNCYAKRMAQRLTNMGQPLYRGVVVKGFWNGTVAVAHADTWNAPRHWRKPRRIFVCSMVDLFHPEVPRGAIKSVSGVAVDCPQHTFLWLTKRGERMAEYTREDPPPPNVWCGISASNGDEWEAAIENLYNTRAAVKWISLEPLIARFPTRLDVAHLSRGEGQLATHRHKASFLSWVVVGCESGPKRRPMPFDIVRPVVDACRNLRIPVFVKQLDINGRVSHDPAEWPEWARVRELPHA